MVSLGRINARFLTRIEQLANKATGNHGKRIALLTTPANVSLASDVARRLGTPLLAVGFQKSLSGLWEAHLPGSLAGRELFIVHTANTGTINEDVMQLHALLTEIAKLPQAKRPAKVVISLLHFPYARQERKAEPREPISAAAMAKLISGVYYLKASGLNSGLLFRICEKRVVDRLVVVNLHSAAIEAAFPIPVDHLDARSLMVNIFIKEQLGADRHRGVITGPDIGRVRMAKKIAEDIYGAEAHRHVIEIVKVRGRKDATGKTQIESRVLGNVRGKVVVIVDDMIDTGGTIEKAVLKLKAEGARRILVVAVHGVLSGPAAERLRRLVDEGLIDRIGVVNTIAVAAETRAKLGDRLVVLNFAPLLAEVISRTFLERTIVGYQSET
ncbi:MAG: ribose-phosphate diphosphokinase [Candidatus Margulisiibacteriota bacterium]